VGIPNTRSVAVVFWCIGFDFLRRNAGPRLIPANTRNYNRPSADDGPICDIYITEDDSPGTDIDIVTDSWYCRVSFSATNGYALRYGHVVTNDYILVHYDGNSSVCEEAAFAYRGSWVDRAIADETNQQFEEKRRARYSSSVQVVPCAIKLCGDHKSNFETLSVVILV